MPCSALYMQARKVLCLEIESIVRIVLKLHDTGGNYIPGAGGGRKEQRVTKTPKSIFQWLLVLQVFKLERWTENIGDIKELWMTHPPPRHQCLHSGV